MSTNRNHRLPADDIQAKPPRLNRHSVTAQLCADESPVQRHGAGRARPDSTAVQLLGLKRKSERRPAQLAAAAP